MLSEWSLRRLRPAATPAAAGGGRDAGLAFAASGSFVADVVGVVPAPPPPGGDPRASPS